MEEELIVASQARFSEDDESDSFPRRGPALKRNAADSVFFCGEKKKFRSKKHANKFLNVNDLDRMHAYFCASCAHYHVGHS